MNWSGRPFCHYSEHSNFRRGVQISSGVPVFSQPGRDKSPWLADPPRSNSMQVVHARQAHPAPSVLLTWSTGHNQGSSGKRVSAEEIPSSRGPEGPSVRGCHYCQLSWKDPP